jgi:CRP-like cAMP-binding protein
VSIAELVGYLAAVLVFTTFYMRTMVRLRVAGIVSNIVFIAYALLEGLVPILILHTALLPLNILRLAQLDRLLRDVEAAAMGSLSLDALLPFMTSRRAKAGEALFRKGDVSREMYHLLRGRIRLEELGITLSAGETFGEMSMFSPTGQRTASAVCETDCELLSLGNERVAQLFYQHPKFGFFLARLITGRLIEDYRRLEARFAGRDNPPDDGLPARGADRLATERTVRRLHRQRWIRRAGLAVAGLLLLVYTALAVTPYLRSVLIRDAVVTTWINTATAPIAGNLVSPPTPVGRVVGADGHVVDIRNDHRDDGTVARAMADTGEAERLIAERERHLRHLRELDAEWRERSLRYAEFFRKKLELAAEKERVELALLEARLALARAEHERMERLRQKGNAALAAAEDAEAALIDLQLLRAAHEKRLADLDVGLQGSERGAYMAADGKEADWAYRGRDQLGLEIARAERELGDARAALENARASVRAAREALGRQATAAVFAPPGSVVWSVLAGAGAAVNAGEPIARWIDCGVVLVDKPMSDLEVALLREDMEARVMLDGEREARAGHVLLARGNASTVGHDDLAAVADRSAGGKGQVVLELATRPSDSGRCWIGRAAFVDFPEIRLVDVIRAWLRL